MNPHSAAPDTLERHATLPFVDRVLGGGLVHDATVLLTGTKGVGRGTLLLQIADALLRRHVPVLYATNRMHLPQLRERAERLGVLMDGRCMAFTCYDDITTEVARLGADGIPIAVIIVDSDAIPMDAANALARFGKETGRVVIFSVQSGDEGIIAGSQALPHLVDVVLDLDTADRFFRLIDPKNRYGEGDVTSWLERTSTGFREVEGMVYDRARTAMVSSLGEPVFTRHAAEAASPRRTVWEFGDVSITMDDASPLRVTLVEGDDTQEWTLDGADDRWAPRTPLPTVLRSISAWVRESGHAPLPAP